MFFDAHIHNKNKESGGFLIALEGIPVFNHTLSNIEAISMHDPNNYYFSFYYVTKKECENGVIKHKYLKYHPRREQYNVETVILSIKRNDPKVVIIDTLNEPFWTPYDYWKIAMQFPNVYFIFTHAGGYLINDFIKICHFQKNVWLDFALTHTTLSCYCNINDGLPYVSEAIQYSLISPFRDKILFGSDYPFFNQDDVYLFYKDKLSLLNNNFLNFMELIK